jgi:cytochrome P450
MYLFNNKHRLHPIAPVNARILKEDTVLSNYKIPKGVGF